MQDAGSAIKKTVKSPGGTANLWVGSGGNHASATSFSSPAQLLANVERGTAGDRPMMTPTTGPQEDPCLTLAPFLCDTPEPQMLEFRSAIKLKEQRKQRLWAQKPYARPPGLKTEAGVCSAAPSVGARRKLLEEEQQRLLELPCGKYSQHRLAMVGKALEILDSRVLDKDAECELDRLLGQLSLTASRTTFPPVR